jgi:hypothetical protein
MWDAASGWYYATPTDPPEAWRETGLPPESEPIDVGLWLAGWLADPNGPDETPLTEPLF